MSERTLVLVIGPESTATRAFTRAFSQHKDILSTGDPSKHIDVLDDVWLELENRNLQSAIAKFQDKDSAKLVVTRRSVPHGIKPGIAAEYMSFPNVELLQQLCEKLEYKIFVLITSRSPIPNLVSWTNARASVQRDISKAYMQYQMAYKNIFKFINTHDLPYFMISVEGFVLDKKNLINSLHKFFQLEKSEISVKTKVDVNKRRYEQFFASDASAFGFE